jgi:hypothetical protein
MAWVVEKLVRRNPRIAAPTPLRIAVDFWFFAGSSTRGLVSGALLILEDSTNASSFA